MRYLVTILIIAAAAAAGYFSRELAASKTFDLSLPFPDLGYSPSTFDLGCNVITEGSAFEDRLKATANSHAGSGTEKLALKLSDDGKTLSVLYAYDVGIGVTEPIPLAVHSKTTSYIVAAGQQTLGETAVILDVKSWKAVVSFTGQGMLGIKGSSYLVQCR
jgi:ribosomal protein L7Ae-like RNA K-turn-binding protein